MIVFIKKPKVNEIGKILFGFGVLFIGMGLMSDAMKPLQYNESFKNLMTSFSNPILGIIAGMVFTAIIQSSSASVGILHALAVSGAIGLDSAVYVLFGQNIGTCITALLVSAETNRCAKRTTIIHLMFNVSGTIIFTLICYFSPFTKLIENFTPGNVTQQIANMHTTFNIITTLLLLPFGTLLVKIAEKLLPDKKETNESIFMFLNNDMNIGVGGTAIRLENTKHEIKRMYDLAYTNIEESFNTVLAFSLIDKNNITETEDLIDKLNEGITKEITNNMSHDDNVEVSTLYSAYLNITHNIERLSDHAMNILDSAKEFINKNMILNDEVRKEIENMKHKILDILKDSFDTSEYQLISDLETDTDNMTKEYKANMMSRLKKSICSPEGSMIYSNILIDFERIEDHLLNISEEISKTK